MPLNNPPFSNPPFSVSPTDKFGNSETPVPNQLPWQVTASCESVLNNGRMFASVLRSAEVTTDHLLAMLALEDSAKLEMEQRGCNPAAVFAAASAAALAGLRVGNQATTPDFSGAVATLMEEAAEIARGFESEARPISTGDVLQAIASRGDGDGVKALLFAKLEPTAAEEARDGIKRVERTINEQLAQFTGLRARVAAVSDELELVRGEQRRLADLAAKTANDNDVRWGRVKTAALAASASVAAVSLYTAFDVERAIDTALTWLSRITA